MKSILHCFLFLLCFSLFTHSSHAQLKSPFAKGRSVAQDVEKILDDYPNRFSSFTGEKISENPQSTDYACTLMPEGAEESLITRYSAGGRRVVVSWNATMLTTESFDDARKKFRQLYGALNNKKISIRLNPYNLKNEGSYEQPTEGKDFYSVVFKLDPNDDRYGHLRVELSLRAVMMEWQVSVSVYERDRADNERGDIKAD
jgi:uncharacterized protein (DUF952 family)